MKTMKHLFGIALTFTFIAMLGLSCQKYEKVLEDKKLNNESQYSLMAQTCLKIFEACIDCCHENDCGDSCLDACYASYVSCKKAGGGAVVEDPFIYPKEFDLPIQISRTGTDSFEVRINDVFSFEEVEIKTGKGTYDANQEFDYKSSLDTIGHAEFDPRTNQWVITIYMPLNSVDGETDMLGVEAWAKVNENLYIGAGLIEVVE